MGYTWLVSGPKGPGDRSSAHFDASEQLDEPAIVTAAGTGDRTAWEVLYRRLYPRLRAYVARRVDTGHVEDTVSETMARAVRGIDSYQPGPAGFDGWVFGIARRVCADYHRHRARLRRQDGVVAAMAEVIEDGAAPGDPAAAADEHAELRRAFKLLLPGDQQVLELRVIAGLTVEQAAGVLEKAPGAVRTAQSRALGRLRQLIKTHDERCGCSSAWGPNNRLVLQSGVPTPPEAVACSPAWGPNPRFLLRPASGALGPTLGKASSNKAGRNRGPSGARPLKVPAGPGGAGGHSLFVQQPAHHDRKFVEQQHRDR
jgi:RNA polymerase sigma-70 factor, ECF subfamily